MADSERSREVSKGPEGLSGPAWSWLQWVVPSLWLLIVAQFVVLGADLLWAVALGDEIVTSRTVPRGIPFIAVDTSQWVNPGVVGQTLLAAVETFHPSALAIMQALIVGVTIWMTVGSAQRFGQHPAYAAAAVSLLVVGAASAFFVTRLPSLSLIPFVLLVHLLRREHAHPTVWIWLVVPLLVVWGNLHGGVLVGAALVTAYLVGSRLRVDMLGAALVWTASVAAILLGTSAGWRTAIYYWTALRNEAAQQGLGLWAPLDLSEGVDLAMVVALVTLLVLWAHRKPPLWELVAVAGLAGGVISAARHGVWLALFLAPLAAGRTRQEGVASQPSGWRPWSTALLGLVVASALSATFILQRGAAAQAPGQEVVPAVRTALEKGDAAGLVLADAPLCETLAADGLQVWACNPIDAMGAEDQLSFLAFLEEGRLPPDPRISVVVSKSRFDYSDQGWEVSERTSGYAVWNAIRTGQSAS